MSQEFQCWCRRSWPGGICSQADICNSSSFVTAVKHPQWKGANTDSMRSDLDAQPLHGTLDQSLLIWDYWTRLVCNSRTGHSFCPNRHSKEKNQVKEQFQDIIWNFLTRFFRISERYLCFIYKNGEICPDAPFLFPCITLELLIAPNTLTRAPGYFLP